MKIVFFSDIHGNKYVLPSFLQSLKDNQVEYTVFCGDIFGYYYYQNEIIDIFKENNFITLLGNHDQYFLDALNNGIDINFLKDKYGNSYNSIKDKVTEENIQFLKKMKPFYELNIDGYRFGVFHGSPSDPLNGRVYPDTEIINIEEYNKYDYVILGHTHHKMEKRINSTIVLNPGSIGQQRDGKGCSYILLDTATGQYEFKIIEYDVSQLLKDVDQYDSGNSKLKEVLTRKK